MEYYIVRIYQREPNPPVQGKLSEIKVVGVVENCNGHKEPFHDVEGMWQLMSGENPAMERVSR